MIADAAVMNSYASICISSHPLFVNDKCVKLRLNSERFEKKLYLCTQKSIIHLTMKHYSWMAVSALLLGFMMLNLTSCSKDEENGTAAPTETEQGGKEDFKPVVVPDVVVTVDDSGQANGGHHFQKIDETSFYIDDIKYTASQGDLMVTGYNEAYFKGAAVIISTLKYQGRTMNVTRVKDVAFKNCTMITSCVIGNKVSRIGNEAFDGCTSLSSVTIPSSVTSIEEGAFAGCSGLRHVYCHAVNPPSRDYTVFYNTPISSATLHVPAESLDAYKATSPWSRFGSIVAL